MPRVLLYSLVLLTVAESSFRPLVLSTAASSSRLLLVNSWLALSAPGGVDHRHQIVGAEARSMNCLAASFDALRPAEARVQVVDHHDVDAAVERLLVGPDVRLDRRGGEQRPVVALDRNVDHA